MSIASADIRVCLSNPEAEAGYQMAQEDLEKSLGAYMATTAWAGGQVHDLFGPLTATDTDSQYRCLFLYNAHATLTWANITLQATYASSGCEIAIGADPIAARPFNSTNPQATEVASQTAAPPGVTFSATAAINLGNLQPGYARGFWLRRRPTENPATTPAQAVLTISGTSLL